MKRRVKRYKGVLLIAFLVFAVLIGALVFRKYETAQRKVVEVPALGAPVGTFVGTLFFAAPGGEGLVREGRELEIEQGIEDGIEAVLDELISGPVGELEPTLPSHTRVLEVHVAGAVARINFGHELTEGLPAGSSAETTAVYSIVDTVTANFPQIGRVQILVDGAPVETLKGHLDLRQPLPPDYTLEKKPVEAK